MENRGKMDNSDKVRGLMQEERRLRAKLVAMLAECEARAARKRSLGNKLRRAFGRPENLDAPSPRPSVSAALARTGSKLSLFRSMSGRLSNNNEYNSSNPMFAGSKSVFQPGMELEEEPETPPESPVRPVVPDKRV